MANVQLEDGFFKIANDLRKALARTRIPGESMQVLWVIFGKTYGFNKKSDHIPLSQFVEETNLSKPHVCQAIKHLVGIGIIITEKGNGITKYIINKDFDTWKPLPKKVTLPKKVIIVTEKGNEGVPNSVHSKYITKYKRHMADSAKIASPAKASLKFFGDEFQKRFGTTYLASFQKDTVLLKKLIKELGQDELHRRIVAFFKDTDQFFDKGRTVGMFASAVNRYVAAKPSVVKEWTPTVMTPEQVEAADNARSEAIANLRQKGIVK